MKEHIKRVVYLNFDLTSPSDLEYYELLGRLGRAKKQVIRMLLENAGMLERKPESKETNKHKTVKHKVSTVEQKTNQPIEELVSEEVTEEKPEKVQEIVMPDLTPETEKNILPIQAPVLPSVTQSVVQTDNETDNPYSMLTEEQIQTMEEKGICYRNLNKNQLLILAEALNEGIPYKAAFMQAQFTQ